jgi:predicted RNase H-like HicB family nuclease
LKLTSTTTSVGNRRFRTTLKRRPWALWSIRADEDQRDHPPVRTGRLETEARFRLPSALCSPRKTWAGYRGGQAERYLETEDRVKHPEASGPAKGAAMKGYVVVFEGDDESGYSAYSPDLPGVIAAGDSRQDTERLMIEAMAAHIAMLQQEGLPVPEPSEAASVTILDPAAA